MKRNKKMMNKNQINHQIEKNRIQNLMQNKKMENKNFLQNKRKNKNKIIKKEI